MGFVDTVQVGITPELDDAGFRREVSRSMRDIASSAERAADSLERSFKDAARDSDAALRKVGGPGTFRGVGRAAEAEGARVRRSMESMSGRGIALFSGLGSAIGNVATQGITQLASLGTAAVKAGLSTASATQMAQIGFTQLLGSAKEADQFIRRLANFAAVTPFELPGLTEAARALIGTGMSADEAMVALKALGEASAALGLDTERFGRVQLAVTQMMNKGKVSAEELLQVNEAGIPIQKILAKALGITTGELLKLGEQGKLQSEVVLPKLFKVMQQDYGGSMAKQAKTLNGAWSTFKDTLNIALGEGMRPVADWLAQRLPDAARILGDAIKSVTGFFRDDLGPELGRINIAWQENEQAITGLFVAMTGYEDHAHGGADAAHDLADSLSSLIRTVGALSEVLNAAGRFLNWMNEDMRDLGSTIHEHTIGPLASWIEGNSHGKAVLDTLYQGVVDTKYVLGRMGITFGETTTATDTATSAAERYTEAVRNEEAATRGLTSATKEEHTASFQLRQAKIDVATAEERLTQLKHDGKKGTNEYKQAQLNLDQAEDRLAYSTDQYRIKLDKSRDAERRAASTSDSLKGAQDALKLSTEGAARAAAGFGDDWQRMLKKLKGKSVKVTADYDTSAPKGFELLVEKGLVRRAGGGGVWGAGSTTSDSIPAWLSDQEHVVSAREVRGLGGGSYARGHQELEGLRAGWRGYAAGGPVAYSQEGGAAFLARPGRFQAMIDRSLAASVRGFAAYIDQYKEQLWGVAGVGRGLSWARAHVGAPYLWGGTGPLGWDCSGWISSITNAIRGAVTNRRLFSTASFTPGGSVAGFMPGLGPLAGFNIGVFRGSPGHMAGTLGGVNVESRGSTGTLVGSAARGATNGIFTMRFHLTNAATAPRPGSGDAPADTRAATRSGRAFDRGGWLWPGRNVVDNRTGRPEHLTNDTPGPGWGVPQVTQYLTISPAQAQAPMLAQAMATIGRREAQAVVGEYERRRARGGRA